MTRKTTTTESPPRARAPRTRPVPGVDIPAPTGLPRPSVPASWLRRKAAAKALGVSVGTLRRMEKDGTLTPRVDDLGHHRHDPEAIRTLGAELERQRQEEALGKRAARASSERALDLRVRIALALDEGASPMETVRKLNADPALVLEVMRVVRRLTDDAQPLEQQVADMARDLEYAGSRLDQLERYLFRR